MRGIVSRPRATPRSKSIIQIVAHLGHDAVTVRSLSAMTRPSPMSASEQRETGVGKSRAASKCKSRVLNVTLSATWKHYFQTGGAGSSVDRFEGLPYGVLAGGELAVDRSSTRARTPRCAVLGSTRRCQRACPVVAFSIGKSPAIPSTTAETGETAEPTRAEAPLL